MHISSFTSFAFDGTHLGAFQLKRKEAKTKNLLLIKICINSIKFLQKKFIS